MRNRLAAVAALVAVAPLAAIAQTATGPEIPAGYFSQVFRSFTFRGCDPGLVCFGGALVFGQRAGTTGPLGYEVLAGVQASDAHLFTLAIDRLTGGFRSNAGIGVLEFQTVVGGTNPTGVFLLQRVPGATMPEFYQDGAPPSSFEVAGLGIEYIGQRTPADPPGLRTAVSLAVTATPEPATVALVAVGVMAVGVVARRRRA